MSGTNQDQIPLCVDLDGTLTLTNTLTESILLAVKRKPVLLFLSFFEILRGKLYFKNKIDEIAIVNPALLPYNEEVISFIKSQREKGRKVYLVTASTQRTADIVARHFDFFDGAFGSQNEINLRSYNKRDFLVKKFGEFGYDYVGDSKADVPIWDKAHQSIVVGSSRLKDKLLKAGKSVVFFEKRQNSIQAILKAIRLHHWIKNILLFFPLLMAHLVGNVKSLTMTGVAFFAFSFIASSIYLINDMFDLEADRSHPRKKFRPLASGALSVYWALFLAPMLMILGILIALIFLSEIFLGTLITYLVVTVLYSFKLKSIYLLDIVILAFLYTLRLFAGAVSANVPVSQWLLEFSMFFFLSIASLKRYTELRVMLEENKTKAKGRGYLVSDISLIQNIGLIAGFLCVLVFTLYINSETARALYKNTELLWFIAVFILIWVMRIWLIAHRGQMHDDPMVFALKDKISLLILVLVIVFVFLATL